MVASHSRRRRRRKRKKSRPASRATCIPETTKRWKEPVRSKPRRRAWVRRARSPKSVAQIRHRYRNGGVIDLQFFTVRDFAGELNNRIFNAVQWTSLAALPTYDFLAADLGLIRDLSEGKLL